MDIIHKLNQSDNAISLKVSQSDIIANMAIQSDIIVTTSSQSAIIIGNKFSQSDAVSITTR
jgi:hypothetical protein